MYEVIIKGKFITGTTQDNAEEAKETCMKLLREKLKSADCLGPSQVFQFIEESIEVEPLGGKK